MCGKGAAKPEFATGLIGVWWDMSDCLIPEGYDARRVRQSLEGAFKKLGYSGPVDITAYGDQKQTPDHILRGLSSTGVDVAHTRSESTCSNMFRDMLIWRDHYPSPNTMMLISNEVEAVFSWDLARLQQQTKYNIFLSDIEPVSALVTSGEWRWKKLLRSSAGEQIICSELRLGIFWCKSCYFETNSLEKFRKHLSSRDHALREVINPCDRELSPVTRMWGRNYPAKPVYATAKIAVWWDMNDCPIPAGYDARRVRPSLEGAFKSLGYSGPVSITAYADQTKTPDHLLRELSSTGVDVAHNISNATIKHMFFDLAAWQNHNPPPATMMLISDHAICVSVALAQLQQLTKYNLFLAYSYRPYQMSVLVTSCSGSGTAYWQFQRQENTVKKGEESTGMFYCKSCDCNCKSLDDFRKHLSSKEHALDEGSIIESIQLSEYERLQRLEASSLNDRKSEENFPKEENFSKEQTYEENISD